MALLIACRCKLSIDVVETRKRGDKGARLDHVVTWNLHPENDAEALGTRWQNVGTEIPDGCAELVHCELRQQLARTTSFGKHEWESLKIQGLTANIVVRVGEAIFRPVSLGRVDWVGGPQHDHARVGFRIAPQVLAHTRKYQPQTEQHKARIRLKDWQRLAPALQRELGAPATEMLAAVRTGSVDAGAAVQKVLKARSQLTRSWMTPTIRSREHQQRRAAHREHEEIQLLRTIARTEAAIKDGPQAIRVTRAQDLVLRTWTLPGVHH